MFGTMLLSLKRPAVWTAREAKQAGDDKLVPLRTSDAIGSVSGRSVSGRLNPRPISAIRLSISGCRGGKVANGHNGPETTRSGRSGRSIKLLGYLIGITAYISFLAYPPVSKSTGNS